MKLETKITLVFKNKAGDKKELETTFKELLSKDLEDCYLWYYAQRQSMHSKGINKHKQMNYKPNNINTKQTFGKAQSLYCV